MRGQERYIKLSTAQRAELENGRKTGKKAVFRERCHYILLSDQGHSIKQISTIYQINRNAISNWFTRYETSGIDGLRTKTGRGRKSILSIDNADHVSQVKQYMEEDCQDLNKALIKLAENQGLNMSRYTLKRFLKKLVTPINVIDAD